MENRKEERDCKVKEEDSERENGEKTKMWKKRKKRD